MGTHDHTRRTWLHYQIIIIMIYGGWIGAIKERLEAFFVIITFCSMGNNGGRFISFFTNLLFFALHNGLPANARPLYPGTFGVSLLFYFFIICSFRLYLVFATNLAGIS